MSGSPLRVAVLGAGTVGREVVHALLERTAELAPADGRALVLTALAVRDVDRAVAAGFPASMVSDAPAHLVADPDVDVVVELMGGDEPAHTLIAAALAMGKSVVTANKHVVAHHGAELEALARRTGGMLRFEAAVGGGIPVLGPLATDLAANRIERVRGIVNGTTNFILTAMTDQTHPIDFAAALAEAQRLGYAEADPSGDVEGLDAVNKLVILARLAFDRWLDPATIATRPDGADGPAGPGITTVSLADQEDAQRRRADHPPRRDGIGRRRRRPDRGGRPADRAAARIGPRPDGRRPQPDRGRCRARRTRRVRRPGGRRRRDVQRGPRRPDRGGAQRRFDMGPETGRRRSGRRARRPARPSRPDRGQRHPVPDR